VIRHATARSFAMRRPWSGAQERSRHGDRTPETSLLLPFEASQTRYRLSGRHHTVTDRGNRRPQSSAMSNRINQRDWPARLAKSHCLEFTPLAARWCLLETFESPRSDSLRDTSCWRRIHPLRDQRAKHLQAGTASSSNVGNPAPFVEPSNGQESQELGLAAHFFRAPLMWNSATDFPAMLLGTISV